jgi:hypothetical protein
VTQGADNSFVSGVMLGVIARQRSRKVHGSDCVLLAVKSGIGCLSYGLLAGISNA